MNAHKDGKSSLRKEIEIPRVISEFSVRFFTILSWILNLNLYPILGNCSLGIKIIGI